LTVIGVIALRYPEYDLPRLYKPFALIPVIYAVVGGFVVMRDAIFLPLQGIVLFIVWVIGVLFYLMRGAWTREVE